MLRRDARLRGSALRAAAGDFVGEGFQPGFFVWHAGGGGGSGMRRALLDSGVAQLRQEMRLIKAHLANIRRFTCSSSRPRTDAWI
jgi:hypothetical protein